MEKLRARLAGLAAVDVQAQLPSDAEIAALVSGVALRPYQFAGIRWLVECFQWVVPPPCIPHTCELASAHSSHHPNAERATARCSRMTWAWERRCSRSRCSRMSTAQALRARRLVGSSIGERGHLLASRPNRLSGASRMVDRGLQLVEGSEGHFKQARAPRPRSSSSTRAAQAGARSGRSNRPRRSLACPPR